MDESNLMPWGYDWGWRDEDQTPSWNMVDSAAMIGERLNYWVEVYDENVKMKVDLDKLEEVAEGNQSWKVYDDDAIDDVGMQ